MTNYNYNIGEAICIVGIIAVAEISKNYWYLCLLPLPFLTWKHIMAKVRDKFNEYDYLEKELDIKIKEQELRLLKKRRK